MNVYKHKQDGHTSNPFLFLVAFYLSVFVLFIVSAFMKRGRGSEIDRICICSHICGGLTHVLDVSSNLNTSWKSVKINLSLLLPFKCLFSLFSTSIFQSAQYPFVRQFYFLVYSPPCHCWTLGEFAWVYRKVPWRYCSRAL